MTEQELNEARIFSMAGHTMLPVVERMRITAYEKVIGAFRQGNTELLTLIASMEALQTLKEEIESKITIYEYELGKDN